MPGPWAAASITGANFTPNTFRACRNGAQDFIALASVLKSSGVKKIVVLAADYDFGHAGAKSAQDAYTPLGLQFAPAIFAPPNTTHFPPHFHPLSAPAPHPLPPTSPRH